MATTVTESLVVRRPVAEVRRLATDPGLVLPIMGGLGRFRKIGDLPGGGEEWDVFLDIGTIHVGGRVHVVRHADALVWESVRGTRHSARLEVVPDPAGSRLTMTLTVAFVGLLTGPLTELLARGVVRRHLQAGLQQLRHHLEHGPAS